jgi:hypothetical protein
MRLATKVRRAPGRLATCSFLVNSGLSKLSTDAGMRRQGSLRPTEDGLAMAKDIWMLGIAAGLLADAATDRGKQK